MSILLIRIAAALCFLAVGLGAFGAHWLKPTLEARNLVDVWNKAVLYHFIHAIALFVLALFGNANRGAWWLLFAGIIIFSGSLYAMGLTGVRWLGEVGAIVPGRAVELVDRSIPPGRSGPIRIRASSGQIPCSAPPIGDDSIC